MVTVQLLGLVLGLPGLELGFEVNYQPSLQFLRNRSIKCQPCWGKGGSVTSAEWQVTLYDPVSYYLLACLFPCLFIFLELSVLQCFDAVGWAAGRASGL